MTVKPMPDLSPMHRTALWFVYANEPIDLRETSDLMRHTLIDLGTMELPLVDVAGDRVSETPAGRSALTGESDG